MQNITGDSKHTTIEFTGELFTGLEVLPSGHRLYPHVGLLVKNHRKLVLSMEFDGKLCAVEFWGMHLVTL